MPSKRLASVLCSVALAACMAVPAFSVSAPALAATAPAATPDIPRLVLVAAIAPAPKSYVTRNGDTLGNISARLYGHRQWWPSLWWANRELVRNPDNLRAGVRLHLPSQFHAPPSWLARKALAATQPVLSPGQAAPAAPAAAAGVSYGIWSCIQAHEGAWDDNTGNGYLGGLQFAVSTWTGFGGLAYAPVPAQGEPFTATPQQQIKIGEKVLAAEGWAAWPNSSRECGV